MKAARWRDCVPILAVTSVFIACTQAEAQGPNLALNKPVIDQSTQWNDSPQFGGQNVTDGNVCEIDQNEGGTGLSSYWLGSEQSQFGQYVTIDLQVPTLITEIHLRNTHNAQFNDRATQDFQIEAGNTTAVGGTLLKPTVTLTDAVVILTGTLSNIDSIICPDEIPPDIFDASGGLMTGGQRFRYIRFVTVDAYGGKGKNIGLNEIEVYGSQ